MKAALLAGLGLITACMGNDLNLEPPTMTLAPPPGPIVLVREAKGSAQGGNDLFHPEPPYPPERWRLGAG